MLIQGVSRRCTPLLCETEAFLPSKLRFIFTQHQWKAVTANECYSFLQPAALNSAKLPELFASDVCLTGSLQGESTEDDRPTHQFLSLHIPVCCSVRTALLRLYWKQKRWQRKIVRITKFTQLGNLKQLKGKRNVREHRSQPILTQWSSVWWEKLNRPCCNWNKRIQL